MRRALLALGLFVASAARANDPVAEGRFLSNTRQLIFHGARSGEGYFSADGSRLVFQSERDNGNPFYQIHILDLRTGETHRVSTGTGKTTCAWFHPNGEKVLFSSTHDDPHVHKEQQAELEFRKSGKQRRYAWDYDPHFDIYEATVDGGTPRNLTRALGYDAEASYSPDGKTILFASNRHAYRTRLSARDAERLEQDPSWFMDLYAMDADGKNVRRLTNTPGYDGGPFYSSDGKRIVWRRFSDDGASAEIFTANADGSDARQVTRLGAMSWAPFFHPSGEYIIFATNLLGFSNFELFMVDARGDSEPVQVTHSDGFDGLPVFSPDGTRLSFTSARTGTRKAQIFLADWNHAAARAALGASPRKTPQTAGTTTPDINAADMEMHVHALTADAMEGRLTGTPGEEKATRYVAEVFRSLGLTPAGVDGTYFQPFTFTAGVSPGDDNALNMVPADGKPVPFKLHEAWRPLAFSRTGPVEAMGIVFAGYGIVAPASDGQAAYDSYTGLDVKDRWVMVLRYLPEDVAPETRQHLARFAPLRHKAMVARDRGARGIIVVPGPHAHVKDQLVALEFDATIAGASIAAITVTDETAQRLLRASGKELGALQASLDGGAAVPGFTIPATTLRARIDLQLQKRTGRNVLARLRVGAQDAAQVVIVGAHVDHLGRGESGNSLARAEEKGEIHHGADDNASGVAGLLEIAEHLASQMKAGRLDARRDVIFAAWSGEELGLLGSNHFVQALGDEDRLWPRVAAYLNMDMIGRLEQALVLQGIGSSPVWLREIERHNVTVGLPIITQDESYLPTDATSFYLKGVPILSAFTGAHAEYHSPRDTPARLNNTGAARVATLMGRLTVSMMQREEPPQHRQMERPSSQPRGSMRIYLGTIPDYAQAGARGLKLSGAVKGGPAEKAGVLPGDLVVELAGRKVESIYDYMYALEALKVGQTVDMVVVRNGRRMTLKVTPAPRE